MKNSPYSIRYILYFIIACSGITWWSVLVIPGLFEDWWVVLLMIVLFVILMIPTLLYYKYLKRKASNRQIALSEGESVECTIMNYADGSHSEHLGVFPLALELILPNKEKTIIKVKTGEYNEAKYPIGAKVYVKLYMYRYYLVPDSVHDIPSTVNPALLKNPTKGGIHPVTWILGIIYVIMCAVVMLFLGRHTFYLQLFAFSMLCFTCIMIHDIALRKAFKNGTPHSATVLKKPYARSTVYIRRDDRPNRTYTLALQRKFFYWAGDKITVYEYDGKYYAY